MRDCVGRVENSLIFDIVCTIGDLEQCVGVPVMKTIMIYYCVVVGMPVCTVQYCSMLETNVLGYIGTVQ